MGQLCYVCVMYEFGQLSFLHGFCMSLLHPCTLVSLLHPPSVKVFTLLYVLRLLMLSLNIVWLADCGSGMILSWENTQTKLWTVTVLSVH